MNYSIARAGFIGKPTVAELPLPHMWVVTIDAISPAVLSVWITSLQNACRWRQRLS